MDTDKALKALAESGEMFKERMRAFVEDQKKREIEEEREKLGDLARYSTTQLKAEIRRRKGEPRKSK